MITDEIYALAAKVYTELCKRKMKIATAESCTGGMIGEALTAVPGMSKCYGFGIISYANEAKISLLGVSADTLGKYGAVSPQTACEMADGALRLSGSDIAVSVTGIAGPGGGTSEKPVGLVYIGFAAKGQRTMAIRNIFDGDRNSVRIQTAAKALKTVINYLACDNI